MRFSQISGGFQAYFLLILQGFIKLEWDLAYYIFHSVLVLDWCYMCKRDEETIDHLLLQCMVAVKLCTMVFSLFGVPWVMSKDDVEKLYRQVQLVLQCWDLEHNPSLPHVGSLMGEECWTLEGSENLDLFLFLNNLIVTIGEGKFEP